MVRVRSPSPTWTTMTTVCSVAAMAAIPNFTRRSTTGMTRPRRLMTPRM